jgi:hypothetical protein
MRVAMFCAGSPRFSEHFYENLSNISNDTPIDLYFCMWDSTLDYRKIFNKIPDNYRIKKFVQIEEPSTEYLSIHGKMKNAESPDCDKIIISSFKQHFGLYKCFSLIEEDYDCYIRFRVDGRLNKKIKLKNYDIQNFLYIPKNHQYAPDIKLNLEEDHFLNEKIKKFKPFNDQFAIANKENMKHYCSLFFYLDEYYFNGLTPLHTQEASLYYHLCVNNVKIQDGDFEHYLNPFRSGSPILPDPIKK